jgi:HEAT repeat protein
VEVEKNLSSRDATVRCLAVNEAARHLLAGEKKALALLRAAAKDESDAVRAVTLSALGVTGSGQRAAVLELIASKVKDSDAEVRERVPEALSRLGGTDGAAALVGLLSDKDAELAKQSARLLWTVTEHLEASDLVPTLESKKPETRLAALSAVKTLGEGRGWDTVASVGAIVRALTKDKDRAVKELATSLVENLGAPLGELLELAKGSTEQRESAATSLGKSRSPEAYEPLLKLLQKDKDIGVRRTAAQALGVLGDRRAIPHLAKYLEDGTFNFNWWCGYGLAKLGGPEVTKLLWKYVTIPDADERSEYMGREATDRLVDMYRARAKVKAGEELNPEHDASPDVDDSVVKLEVLTGSKDGRLVERGLKLLEFGDDVEAAASALSSQREETARQALRTLSDMLSRQVAKGLNRGLDTFKKRALAAVVPHAAAVARRAGLREGWLDLLASLGGSFARDTVLAAMKDPEPDVRAAAARALYSLGADGTLDLLAPLLDEKANHVRHAAAGAFGSFKKDKAAATKVLTQFLKGAKGSSKAAAESSLRELRGEV